MVYAKKCCSTEHHYFERSKILEIAMNLDRVKSASRASTLSVERLGESDEALLKISSDPPCLSVRTAL